MGLHLPRVGRFGSVAFASGILLVFVATGCAPGPTSGPTPTPTGETSAGHAEAAIGSFRLTFDLPRTTWDEGEAITGLATLELIGPGAANLGGSGTGLVGFGFEEIGRHRAMVPAWTADCRPYGLEAGRPMTSAITKSGGFSGEDPDAAFYRAFFQDPEVRLPAGTWRITAVASFSEGPDCSGPSRNLQAPIVVLISPSS